MNECTHSQDGEYIACIHCDIEHASKEAYFEGIAWERKRFEILIYIERDCKCDDSIEHLITRIQRNENGIDYDREFGDIVDGENK